MASREISQSERAAATTAGYSYLVIAALSLFANFLVRGTLVDPDSADRTFMNIANSESLFRLGIASFALVFVLDVVIAWSLYVFFRRTSAQVALLTAWFRLVYTTILGVAVLDLLIVMNIINADHMFALERTQSSALVMIFLDAFNYGWLIGLICFGVHLVLVGYLLWRSELASRALAGVVAVAGGAYVVDSFANFLLGNYSEYEMAFLIMVAIPSLIGELWFAIWLISKGRHRRERITIRGANRGEIVGDEPHDPAVPGVGRLEHSRPRGPADDTSS